MKIRLYPVYSAALLALAACVADYTKSEAPDELRVDGAETRRDVAFAAGSAGTLVLDQGFAFSGIISGMTASNHLDLPDFSFAKGTTLYSHQ